MAMRFASLKESILVVLYDYMLTSDHEGFWFNIPSLQDALPPTVSGAFVQRALDSLIEEKMVAQGASEPLAKDLFALTDYGISRAEDLIEERGIEIEAYEPAPEVDEILSRLHHPEKFAQVSQGIAELANEVRKNNSLDEETGGNADLIEGELKAADALLEGGRIRVTRLKALILPTLRYLAKKFADQSIGEVAKRLIALLLDVDL